MKLRRKQKFITRGEKRRLEKKITLGGCIEMKKQETPVCPTDDKKK